MSRSTALVLPLASDDIERRPASVVRVESDRIFSVYADVSLARMQRRRMHMSYFLDNPLNELARSRPSEVMSRYSMSA